jgi:methionine-gamma-lyase
MSGESTDGIHGDLATTAVHAGRADLSELGVHAPPVDLSTTFPVGELEAVGADLDAWSAGAQRPADPIYGRLHNATVARYEAALAQLERTEAAIAYSSGMAALSACLLAACQDRKHVVALRPLYGTSDHLLASGLLTAPCTWASGDDLIEAIRPDTGLIVLETPTNPTLTQVDIAAIVEAAGDVPVLVDNTFATPVLQRPALHGATFVLHSATKFLGGHGDVIAGAVATDEDWAARLRQVRFVTGGLLHPWAAYLLHRSLPTLPLRVRAAQATAEKLACRLARTPAVREVHYPGLPDRDPDRMIGRQMAGPGALLAFEIDGGLRRVDELFRALTLITPAVSLGTTDTLIQHPASLTHRIMTPEDQQASGISNDLVRLSVGLEDVDDLWRDLSEAIAASGR